MSWKPTWRTAPKPSFGDQGKAAFSSASESCKQLITLSTALIGLEITFAKDLAKNLDLIGRILVGVSWGLFLTSVVFGVLTLLALTGSLGSNESPSGGAIYKSNIRIPAFGQVLLFLLGLLTTVTFGLWALFHP